VRANFQYSELDFASEDRTEGILGIVFGSTTRDASCDKGIERFGDQVIDRVSAASEPAAKLTFLRELDPNVILTLQELASGCNSAQRLADTNGSQVRNGCAGRVSFTIFIESDSQDGDKECVRVTVIKDLVAVCIVDRTGVRPLPPSKERLEEGSNNVCVCITEKSVRRARDPRGGRPVEGAENMRQGAHLAKTAS
jgi:hypothetical protein